MPTKYREEKSAVIADICRMAIKIFTNVNGSSAINIRALPHLHPYKIAWSKRMVNEGEVNTLLQDGNI